MSDLSRRQQIYKQERVRPALVAGGIAECQISSPNTPIVSCDTRRSAEEWVCRYLAAAHDWASHGRGRIPASVRQAWQQALSTHP